MATINHETARQSATDLLVAAGLLREHADAVAGILVESDLLGHRTHGLAMLPVYLDRLADGRIATRGEIETVDDSGATFAWRVKRLAGAWVMQRAIDLALSRVETHPVVTATVANCSHIGCLQAYLEPIGRRGLLALLMVTDPGVISVAPFGGVEPVLTSNPIAVCIPTNTDPILIDQSTSVVSNQAVAQHRGERLPGQWILNAQGRASDDPADVATGTLMPLGGEEFGFKGFGFGLMVEAFALALSGHSRNLTQERGGQGVFLQLIDPRAFAGRDAFLAATTDLVQKCKASRPAPGRGVRMPGERALRDKAAHLAAGIPIEDAVVSSLNKWAEKLGTTPWRQV